MGTERMRKDIDRVVASLFQVLVIFFPVPSRFFPSRSHSHSFLSMYNTFLIPAKFSFRSVQ